MKTLAEQMAIYGVYHRNPWNRLTHFIGVPMIIFAILVALSMPRFSIGTFALSPAMLLVACILIYYLLLDWGIGLAMVPVLGALLYGADRAATQLETESAWLVFTAAFIGGWAVQLLGHVFEGRRPALVDNIWQIFVAPIFLVVEACFMFGTRKELKNDVESRIRSAMN